jgi:hypothetical protein
MQTRSNIKSVRDVPRPSNLALEIVHSYSDLGTRCGGLIKITETMGIIFPSDLGTVFHESGTH